MANAVRGIKTLSLVGDEAGNRTREVRYLVYRDNVNDGPDEALSTAGLPTYGDSYSDGKGHTDTYCFCTQRKQVRRFDEKEGEVGHLWAVERTFTTVPPKGRCKADDVQHPLDVPPEVSCKCVRYTEEGLLDKDDQPILTSSFELIRGPQNEWELSNLQITIKCAVSDAQIVALTNMKDTVNKYTLWGFPPRTVKLSEFSLDSRFLGNCQEYADRTLIFDVRYRARRGVTDYLTQTGTGTELIRHLEPDTYAETWDRYALDEGTKVLNGHWSKATGYWVLDPINGVDPDWQNPSHYKRFQDRAGNVGRVVLNGRGVPADTVVVSNADSGTNADVSEISAAGRKWIQYYGESDFALLERLPTGIFPLVEAT